MIDLNLVNFLGVDTWIFDMLDEDLLQLVAARCGESGQRISSGILRAGNVVDLEVIKIC